MRPHLARWYSIRKSTEDTFRSRNGWNRAEGPSTGTPKEHWKEAGPGVTGLAEAHREGAALPTPRSGRIGSGTVLRSGLVHLDAIALFRRCHPSISELETDGLSRVPGRLEHAFLNRSRHASPAIDLKAVISIDTELTSGFSKKHKGNYHRENCRVDESPNRITNKYYRFWNN